MSDLLANYWWAVLAAAAVVAFLVFRSRLPRRQWL